MKLGKGGLQVLSAANSVGFLATRPFAWRGTQPTASSEPRGNALIAPPLEVMNPLP
jgi:hypothetical protein